MKYGRLATIAFIFSLSLCGACAPSDTADERPTRDAESSADADSAGNEDASDAERVDAGEARVAAITISPTDPTMELNTALKLEATAVDSRGAQIPSPPVTWMSADPEIATVNEYGSVIGVALGSVAITAVLDDVSGTALVTVAGKPVETLDVVPKVRTLQIGEQVELSVFLEDINGTPVEDAREVVFSSSAPEVSTVSGEGLVTGVSAGSATITASAEGKSDSAAITVEAVATSVERVEITPPSARLIRGDTIELQAAVFEAGGIEVADPSVAWTSSAPGVAVVDASGLVTTVGEGSATIIASSGGRSDTSQIDVSFSLEALARGERHGCGLIRGVAHCWGDNQSGQLGRGQTSSDEPLGRVLGAQAFVAVSLGASHSCALTSAGEAYCWGANDAGQLGDGTETDRHAPTLVQGSHTFASIAAGARHTCGVDVQGTSWCWGANGFGQLGDGTTTASNVPVQLSAAASVDFATLFAGNEHTCGVTSSGQAYCWGRNHLGQLGVDNTTDRHSPAQVLGGYEFGVLSLGAAHTCGIATAGSTTCWGANGAGQLGDGTNRERHTPILISAPVSFSKLSAGSQHTCALAAGGHIYCWGADDDGQLGLASTTGRNRPTRAPTTTAFSDVHVGGTGSCALDVTGKPHCWGAPDGADVPTRVPGF